MSENKVLDGLYYTKEHEWVRVEGQTATVGLTDYAQSQLGDVTFVELPAVGRQVAQMGEFCVVESVKAASDVYAPLSGEVAEVNAALEETPGLINQDCYGAGWLAKLTGIDLAELDNLLDADAYRRLITEA